MKALFGQRILDGTLHSNVVTRQRPTSLVLVRLVHLDVEDQVRGIAALLCPKKPARASKALYYDPLDQ